MPQLNHQMALVIELCNCAVSTYIVAFVWALSWASIKSTMTAFCVCARFFFVSSQLNRWCFFFLLFVEVLSKNDSTWKMRREKKNKRNWPLPRSNGLVPFICIKLKWWPVSSRNTWITYKINFIRIIVTSATLATTLEVALTIHYSR